MSSGSDQYWKDKKAEEKQKEFLEKNFPAGEYSVLTILVRNDELTRFMEHLKKANCNLAVMPNVKADIDFASTDDKDTKNS